MVQRNQLKWKLKSPSLRQFVRALERAGKQVTGLQLLKALRAGENFAIAQVKINIRQLELIKSGNLINSVQEDRVKTTKNQAWVWFGPHTVYAAIHEFGGIIHSTSGKGLIFKTEDGHWVRTQSVTIPARPYLRPGVDEHYDEIMETMKNNLLEEVESAFYNG